MLPQSKDMCYIAPRCSGLPMETAAVLCTSVPLDGSWSSAIGHSLIWGSGDGSSNSGLE